MRSRPMRVLVRYQQLALLALVATIAVACGGAVTPSPTPTAAPAASASPTATISPTAPAGVSSPAQAAALVFASDPHFGAIRPANPDLIGECCTYEAVDEPPGYKVTIELGWGDCPAGCISHHRWQFHVDTDGTITLVSQAGDADPPVPAGEGVTATVTLHLRAGPTCPVVRNPPDSGCEARSVANADVIVRSPDGSELARGTSNAQGEIALQVPPAAYYVEPQPVEGLIATAPAVAFSVVGGETVDINLDYDTGIR